MKGKAKVVSAGAAVLAVFFGTVAIARESVVFVCAHPDDLGGCSGTAMLLAEKFDVHVIDYTHGERGLGEAQCRDGSCRAMRTKEEERACALVPAQLHWMEVIDGEADATMENCRKLADLLRAINPRAVIAHWPLDLHLDHAMSSVATLKAIELAKLKPEVYFQEQPHQTRSFQPVLYVPITSVKGRKDMLIDCYSCQGPEAMKRRKTQDAVFRGRAIGRDFAEAFAVMGNTVRGRGVLDEIGAVR